VNPHPPAHHPLDTHYDSVADEPSINRGRYPPPKQNHNQKKKKKKKKRQKEKLEIKNCEKNCKVFLRIARNRQNIGPKF
jgi:hypothetical protein